MYVFAGGLFNSRMANDFNDSNVWAEVLNKLQPDIVVPTYDEINYGRASFTNIFNRLNLEPLLTNGNDSENMKLNANFCKHRIVKIKGENILLLGVLCDLKIKNEWSKYLKLVPIIESIK